MNSEKTPTWRKVVTRFGAVVVVLAAAFAGGCCLAGNPPWHIESLADYLAWAGGGAGSGVALAEFGAVMKSVTSNEDWDSWSSAGKLASAFWVVIVSASAMAV